IDEKEARQKMSNQMDIEKKKELADFCIDNSTTLRNLQSEIERIIGEIS
ncbi:MAG: dephospho-CoA kinase, partial [Campylobacteraceae bacterium]|nr:dephospho-CoA kinase [Campylobacteraceae bacterium]